MTQHAQACPLPDRSSPLSEAAQRMLVAHRIAVVGLSDDPSRVSFGIAQYLLSTGRDVVPVNPNAKQVLGLHCYASLGEVPGPIEVVNVFRRSEYCADVVREAIAVGARGVWLQLGIVNEEARRLAEAAGIDFVQNSCIMVADQMR